MPKAAFILFAALVVGVATASCNSGSSSVSPTPTPTYSVSPNPSVKSVQIDVTRLGSPAPNVPVAESTPANANSPRPGTTIVTQTTGKKGQTTFKNLKPSATYCWVALLPGGKQTSETCAGWPVWQSGPISLGT